MFRFHGKTFRELKTKCCFGPKRDEVKNFVILQTTVLL